MSKLTNFWGLKVGAGKKFKHQFPEALCLSGAAVEPLGGSGNKYDDNPIQLYMEHEHGDYLLCSLAPKQGVLQTLLNVRIGCGEIVGFYLKGGCKLSKVHLTGFSLQEGSASTPTNSKPQKSILVTQPRSNEKQPKRVSIKETEPYGEVEMESSDVEFGSDDENEESVTDIRKRLFGGMNGDSIEVLNADSDDDEDDDDDDEDDDDDNSDSDLNDGEIQELAQFKQKGKYNPETGGRVDEEDDDSDDSEDDDDDSSDDNTPTNKGQNKNNLNKADAGKQFNSRTSSPPMKRNSLDKSSSPKTPENQNLKLKTPSSAGHTPMNAMKTFTKGGVLCNDVNHGSGQIAKSGKMVCVYYSGRLKSNNKMFDSAVSGPGFKFRLGKGEVIRGWDLGVEGMKVGGKRRLIIPPSLAYGKKGAPPDIPPNSTLVFDVELKNVS